MSVINRMLKDLEARGAGAEQAPLLRGVKAMAPRRRRWHWLRWGGVLLSVVGLGAVWYLARTLEPSAPPAQLPPAVHVQPPCSTRPAATAVAGLPAVCPLPAAPAVPLTPVVVRSPQPSGAALAPVGTALAAPPPPQPTAERLAAGDATAPLMPEERGERAWRAALAAFARGDETAGRAELRTVLAVQPLRHQARLLLAEHQAQQGGAEEACQTLMTGVRLDSQAFALRRAAAQNLASRGEIGAALALLEEGDLPPAASDPDGRALLGALRQRLGRYDAAAQAYRDALSARPRQGGYWLGLALALESEGARSEASAAYRAALDGEALAGTLAVFARERLAVLEQRRP